MLYSCDLRQETVLLHTEHLGYMALSEGLTNQWDHTHNHSIIVSSHHLHMGAVLCPHPARGEPSIQRHTKRWQQTMHYKIFAQTGFLLDKDQLKLMMSHLQQLFTLHWDRRLRRRLIMITAHTSKGIRWIFPGVGEIMFFPWNGRKNFPVHISNYNIHRDKLPIPTHAYQYNIKPNR